MEVEDGVWDALLHYAGYGDASPRVRFGEMIAYTYEYDDWTIDDLQELADIFDRRWSGGFRDDFDEAYEEFTASL